MDSNFTAEAYIGLGSNLAQPVQQLKSAVNALSRQPSINVQVCSSLYRTAPIGPQDQPDFVNAVLLLHTDLNPQALLELCQAIEQAHGRLRSGTVWGPRTLDLDILLYRTRSIAEEPWLQVDTETLRLPHPQLEKRAFVVTPLLEIAPTLSLRPDQQLVDLLPLLADQGIKKLEEALAG